jgi:CDP-diacylglycerol--serine O-phosphatidyltransferase
LLRKSFVKFVRWIGYDLGISPNQVTIGRLFCFVPGWFIWFYRHDLAASLGWPWQVFGAIAIIIVFTVVSFDIVDGALARETGQVSDQGKVLDPIVDKLITYSTLALFWHDISKTGFFVLLALDLCSTFLRGSRVQGANQFGKRKALAQNISKIFFAFAVIINLPQLNLVGNILIWLAVILASISVGVRVLSPKTRGSVRIAIPQLVTLCNLGGGLGAIWLAAHGEIALGVLFTLIAMLFDLGDGAIARKLGVSSNFGKQFDTMADMVSFGMAPAALAVAVNGWRPLAMLIGVGYFLATMLRLYDYGRSRDITPKGFFRGLPSPAGAWLVVASTLFPWPWLAIIVMIVAATLMCMFVVNWIHFNRIFSTMCYSELAACIGLGLIIAAVLQNPAVFAAGPILVYIISPTWRKPALPE